MRIIDCVQIDDYLSVQNWNCCHPAQCEEVSVPEKLGLVETLHKGNVK